MSNNQSQKAGANSQQLQAETINILQQFGIDDKRAREISVETINSMRSEFTAEAFAIANTRARQLEEILIPKMSALEGALNHFADPGFQLLLAKAHKAAAATEREADYDLLSELLIERVKKGTERNIRAGINIAIEIVDQMADDALLGLTAAYLIAQIRPTSGNISDGLNTLESIFKAVLQRELPSGDAWIDHLEALRAVRIIPVFPMKKIAEYYQESLDGYISVGIESGSENHLKAEKILKSVNLSRDLLVPHELRHNYARLPVINKEAINSLTLTGPVQFSANGQKVTVSTSIPLPKEQCNALRSIYDLYDTDANKMQENLGEFIKRWDSNATLSSIRDWWEKISVAFNITSAGSILAHANAQRCDNRIPKIK